MTLTTRRAGVALVYAGLVRAIGEMSTVTVNLDELEAFEALLQSAPDAVRENRERLVAQTN